MNPHMARSLQLAADAGDHGNRPFGAVLVSAGGHVLGEGRNEVASDGDLTAHAELVAIRSATAAGLGEQLDGSVMYASGEPCPMCAAACVWAGVARIVFGASTAGFSPVLPDGPHFVMSCHAVIATSDAKVEVCGPVCEQEALAVMRAAIPPVRLR